ncbi:unnamed protein product [Mucor hiemalis]
MGTTKRRQAKRNDSRQTALTFLSNITLGNEHEIQKLSAVGSTTIEYPTTAQHTDNCTSPTTPASRKRPSLTEYGTLSMSKNSAAKGFSLDSSDSNSTTDEQIPTPSRAHRGEFPSSEDLLQESIMTTEDKRSVRRISSSTSSINSNRRRCSSSSSSNSLEVIRQYKLTREDSERPIASEKIKKKSDHQGKNSETGSTSFMSVFRYYKGFIRQPRRRSENFHHHNGHNHHIYYHSYFQQHSANLHLKHRKALSYGHFLSTRKLQPEQVVPTCSSSSDEATTAVDLRMSPTEHALSTLNYDPHYFDDGDYLSTTSNAQNSSTNGLVRPSILVKSTSKKKELNDLFRKKHPEITAEVTLSKINSIKTHLLNIGKVMDLEISSISHAFVYFEKLIQKQIVNKQNRKLVAACCLFLAAKINEPKGSWFEPLLEAIHSEFNISSKDVRSHEFAVFADLEFNLYVPLQEFMPHFDKIFSTLDYKCLEDYIGSELFYENMIDGHEIVDCASPTASPQS